MLTPVGAAFNVTGMVAVPIGAATGLTLTVTAAPAPVMVLQFSAILAGVTVNIAACMVPVEIANASSENRVVW